MKETQQHIKDFLEKRPIMHAHDSVNNVAGHMKGELDEFLEEYSKEGKTHEDKEKLRMELADVGFYLMTLGNIVDMDVLEAIETKLEINNRRFPAHLFQEGSFDVVYASRKRELGEWR